MPASILRCSCVHRHGVQDGAQLQVQITKAVSSGKVSLAQSPRYLQYSPALSDINVSVDSNQCFFLLLSTLCRCCVRIHEHRSMNTFLIIYLGILLFEAILSTILKYAWQAEDKWNEPFYNQKTEQERNSSQVSPLISFESLFHSVSFCIYSLLL